MSGALLVAGTTSDAGKSMVVAGLCRLLARKGIRVAPFKAQNMSNNSAVTTEGGEIGRAQAMQARAAGLAPSVRFNPILLKPGSDRTSQLVLRGRVVDTVKAADYITHRDRLAAVVTDELQSLRSEFDAVICEGAGSPAEINLRATDLANMGLARAANLPVILVGDIDRGGLLAHLYGTVAVLEPDDQRLISGFVVNKFRGDPALLAPGLDQLRELTGRPTYGVIPYTDGLWLDTEDSVSVLAHRVVGDPQPPRGPQWLRVAAIRLPRISNSTDVEALACEPGVLVRWVTDPADLADADAVVIPGSKATVPDLAWLRERGLADGITAHARQGKPMLGICGGFQMLCRRIDDPVESMAGLVDGLGLLDADIAFAPEKTVRATGAALAATSATGAALAATSATGAALAATSATGAALAATSDQATPLHGYEIHHGQVARSAEDDWLGVGIRRGHVYGTHWHGLLDNDELRRRWLTDAAAAVGRSGFVVADDVDVAGRRDAQLDLMADLLTAHLDIDAVVGLLEHGPPKRPTLATALA
jgi:adenosylcobyric acid synthase